MADPQLTESEQTSLRLILQSMQSVGLVDLREALFPRLLYPAGCAGDVPGPVRDACAVIRAEAQKLGLRLMELLMDDRSAFWSALGGPKPAWLCHMLGEVPWLGWDDPDIGGHTHRETDLFAVSRHAIAEATLICPLCDTQAAANGCYDDVRRMRVGNQVHEVVACRGKRIVHGEREAPCGAILFANPDTEHGDHLLPDGSIGIDSSHDRPEFFFFRRATDEERARFLGGDGVAIDTDGRGLVVVSKPLELFCPACRVQHLDPGPKCPAGDHAAHTCIECGHTWSPEPGPTRGVERVTSVPGDVAEKTLLQYAKLQTQVPGEIL